VSARTNETQHISEAVARIVQRIREQQERGK
jgi:hypothetical protein